MKTLGDTLEAEYIPKVFHECEVIYEASWNSYEENGWVIVFKFFDEIMVFDFEYSVMSSDTNVYFDPYPINPKELLELKEEWDNIEDFR